MKFATDKHKLKPKAKPKHTLTQTEVPETVSKDKPGFFFKPPFLHYL